MEGFKKLIQCWFLVISWILTVNSIHSGFYADNVFSQQTVLVEKLEKDSRQAMKDEILALLGLHHVPRPLTHATEDSAPTFMLDLYRTLQNEVLEEENEWLQDVRQEMLDKKLALPGMEQTAEHADMIMSFINQGEYQ